MREPPSTTHSTACLPVCPPAPRSPNLAEGGKRASGKRSRAPPAEGGAKEAQRPAREANGSTAPGSLAKAKLLALMTSAPGWGWGWGGEEQDSCSIPRIFWSLTGTGLGGGGHLPRSAPPPSRSPWLAGWRGGSLLARCWDLPQAAPP